MTGTGGLSTEDVEWMETIKRQDAWREQQKEAEKRKATSVREEQRRLQDMERVRKRAFAEKVVEAEAGGDGAMYVQIGSGLRRQIQGQYWCQLCERSLTQNNLEVHIMSRDHQKHVEGGIGWGGWGAEQARPTPAKTPAKQQAMPPQAMHFTPPAPQAMPSPPAKTPPPKQQPVPTPAPAAPPAQQQRPRMDEMPAPPFPDKPCPDPRQAAPGPPFPEKPYPDPRQAAPPFPGYPDQRLAALVPPPPPNPWPTRPRGDVVPAASWQKVGYDGTVYCELCRKVADESHLCSAEHQKRMDYFCHQEQNRTHGFEPPALEYLAWVPLQPDDVTGERQLKCLLCDKWVNDPWAHSGSKEFPQGSKDHKRYLQYVGGRWYCDNVIPQRRRWHPPSGPQRRPPTPFQANPAPAIPQGPRAHDYSPAAPSAPRPARGQPVQLVHASPEEEGLIEEC